MAASSLVSGTTLARAMAGRPIKRSSLLSLADALRVPPSWLLEGEGEFNPEWVKPPALGPLPGAGAIARGPVMPLPLPRGTTEDQAPLRRTQIDAGILAKVLDLIDLIAKNEPNEVKARRIARAYDEATLPADQLPPLPAHPRSESPR